MKVTRQNITESYNTTAGWLDEFCKQSNYIESVLKMRDQRKEEKFATIEEKMEDIKKRIGYGQPADAVVKSASEHECNCNNCEKCQANKAEDSVSQDESSKLKKVTSMIKHYISIIKNDPDISDMGVVSKLREAFPDHFFKFVDMEAMMKDIRDRIANEIRENAEDLIEVPDYQSMDNETEFYDDGTFQFKNI